MLNFRRKKPRNFLEQYKEESKRLFHGKSRTQAQEETIKIKKLTRTSLTGGGHRGRGGFNILAGKISEEEASYVEYYLVQG